MILAEFGAEVTKVEPPQGDATRSWGPPFWEGISPTYLALNRNKSKLTVDAKTPEGKKRLTDLARRADVFLTSSRPGAMAKLGLNYESLLKVNTHIIYGEITPFGDSGPRSSQPGYDPIIEALTGIMSVTGHQGSPPVRAGVSIVDLTAGLWLAFGVQVALRMRETTDSGHHVRVSLYEVGIALNAINIGSYWASGVSPRPWGSGVAMVAPYEAFPTKDGWLMIAAGNDELFKRLSWALGHHEWIEDARFRTNDARVQNRVLLTKFISEITSKRECAELERLLGELGVPVGRVQDIASALGDPQLSYSDIVQKASHPAIHDFKSIGLPLTIDGMRPPLRRPPP